MSGAAVDLAISPALADVFRALDEAGIEWCLLRGETQLDGSSEDVDLLVAESHMERFAELVRRHRFVRVRLPGHGPHAFFVAYDPRAGAWFTLDAVAKIAFGQYQTIETTAASALLARRERRAGVPVLQDSDGFWCLVLHCMLDKGAFSAQRRHELQRLVSAAPGDEAPGRPPLPAERDRRARILRLVEAGEWEELGRLGAQWRREWDVQHPRTRWRRYANRFVRVTGSMMQPFSRAGLSVAVLAPDGAGKTTLAHALAESFHPWFRAMYVYMGFGDGGRRWRNVPGASFSVTIVRYARFFLARRLGRFVVFDRHPYDALVPPERELGYRSRAHRWFLAHLHPTPDVVVVLDAPADVLHARRSEHSVDELARSREAYLALARGLDTAVVIDATRDPEAVRRAALSAIWKTYVTKPARGRGR